MMRRVSPGTQRMGGVAARIGTPQAALRVVQSRHTLAEAMRGAPEEVIGFVPVQGVGELVLETHFPVNFVDVPAVYGGGSLDVAGDASAGDLVGSIGLHRGQFPTWSVGAAKWHTRIQGATKLYVGAVLVVVVTGHPDQRSCVNWMVRGRALRNPVTGG